MRRIESEPQPQSPKRVLTRRQRWAGIIASTATVVVPAACTAPATGGGNIISGNDCSAKNLSVGDSISAGSYSEPWAGEKEFKGKFGVFAFPGIDIDTFSGDLNQREAVCPSLPGVEVVELGGNNLLYYGDTAASVDTKMSNFIAKRIKNGLKASQIFVTSITPETDAANATNHLQPVIDQVNADFQATYGDHFIDTATGLKDATGGLAPQYHTTLAPPDDPVHLSVAGEQQLGAEIYTALTAQGVTF